MIKTFKVSNGCKKCGNDIYYYPAKLVLESNTEIDLTEKRLITLTCSDGKTKHTSDYEFPKQFIEI
jgi:hypothetical protein